MVCVLCFFPPFVSNLDRSLSDLSICRSVDVARSLDRRSSFIPLFFLFFFLSPSSYPSFPNYPHTSTDSLSKTKVDGNGWSARFRRLMASNSLVLKSTVFPEWFTDRIQPWVHYVPVKVDYSDLYDILLFFRGDLGISRKSKRRSGASSSGSGAEGGEDGEEEDGDENEGGEGGREGYDYLAEKIASEGKKWIGEYWREEDMTAYMFRYVPSSFFRFGLRHLFDPWLWLRSRPSSRA